MPSPANPNPDGACVSHCDCGAVPCGEYLFDHRNGTQLRDWLVGIVVAQVNENSFGAFIDDFWCSNIVNGTGSCSDPVQGPTEIDRNSQADMGLSDEDIADITRGWLATMTAAQQALLDAGGYTWSLIPGQDNANAAPLMVGPDASSCNAALREACRADSPWLTAPLLAGVHMGSGGSAELPSVDADVAAFLLSRGPWAWIGAGVWGMSWPSGLTWNSSNTPVARPPQLDADYGAPLDAFCSESSPEYYERRYEHAHIALNCSSFEAQIVFG